MNKPMSGPAARRPDRESAQQIADRSYPLVELRQYTLHEGMRDRLITLFEDHFIESQEAFGMKVIGTFTDLDRPDRFVWLRGFRDMHSRRDALSAFYNGPTWLEHRDQANATMIDSDNVLLLRAGGSPPGFPAGRSRPGVGEDAAASLIVATIEYLLPGTTDGPQFFEAGVKPHLEAAGISPLAWFVSESAPNNFPRLPVREGEHVLVWFARFADEPHYQRYLADTGNLSKANDALDAVRASGPEVLRLVPTPRSELR